MATPRQEYAAQQLAKDYSGRIDDGPRRKASNRGEQPAETRNCPREKLPKPAAYGRERPGRQEPSDVAGPSGTTHHHREADQHDGEGGDEGGEVAGDGQHVLHGEFL